MTSAESVWTTRWTTPWVASTLCACWIRRRSSEASLESITPRLAACRRPCTTGSIRPRSIAPSAPAPSRQTPIAFKELEPEVKELRRANDILKTTSAFSSRRSSPAAVMTTESCPAAGCCRWPGRVTGATQPDNAPATAQCTRPVWQGFESRHPTRVAHQLAYMPKTNSKAESRAEESARGSMQALRKLSPVRDCVAALLASIQLTWATLSAQPTAAHESYLGHEQPLGTQRLARQTDATDCIKIRHA